MIAHVDRERQHARALRRDPGQVGFRLFEMVLVDAGNRDVYTALQQRGRNGEPDAARTTGDDCNLPSRDAMAKLYDSPKGLCHVIGVRSLVAQGFRLA
jgi:hypothetical protein